MTSPRRGFFQAALEQRLQTVTRSVGGATLDQVQGLLL